MSDHFSNYEYPQWIAQFLPGHSPEHDSKLTESKSLVFALALYLIVMLVIIGSVKYCVTGKVI